ncbi:hypothetical protein AcW1_009775 [Taiwanofungus camphoratus]|nr:hypothetical protein AcW1_009775 [Antrodia cinnamomea]
MHALLNARYCAHTSKPSTHHGAPLVEHKQGCWKCSPAARLAQPVALPSTPVLHIESSVLKAQAPGSPSSIALRGLLPDPLLARIPHVHPSPRAALPRAALPRPHARTHSLSPARLGRHASRIRGFCHSVQCLPLPSLPLRSARLNSITHQRPADTLAGVPDGRSNTVISVRRGRVVWPGFPQPLFADWAGRHPLVAHRPVPHPSALAAPRYSIVAAPRQIGPLRCNRPAGVPDTGVPSHIAHRTSHIAHRVSHTNSDVTGSQAPELALPASTPRAPPARHGHPSVRRDRAHTYYINNHYSPRRSPCVACPAHAIAVPWPCSLSPRCTALPPARGLVGPLTAAKRGLCPG